MAIPQYPKIFTLGDSIIASLLDEEVEITEKVDGSQFSFGKVNGELYCRSKGKVQSLDSPDALFIPAIEYVKSITEKLPNGYVFHGETLARPRHSTITYRRIPKNHIALFGVRLLAENVLLPYEEIKKWAETLGVEVVPLLYYGKITPDEILGFLDRDSFLGGSKIEGVVVKVYEKWEWMGQVLPVKCGKFVSERFKEVHKESWARLNTSMGGLEGLKESLHTEARWRKAIMRLKEDGLLTGTLKDIEPLIKEIKRDVLEEEKENLKEELWRLFKEDLLRASVRGFPEWYKESLLKNDL